MKPLIKIFILFIAIFCLCLSLPSCGGKSKSKDKSKTTTNTTPDSSGTDVQITLPENTDPPLDPAIDPDHPDYGTDTGSGDDGGSGNSGDGSPKPTDPKDPSNPKDPNSNQYDDPNGYDIHDPNFYNTIIKRYAVCESTGDGYTKCLLTDPIVGIRVYEHLSGAPCTLNDSFGFNNDEGFIWVDKGCRANFEFDSPAKN